MGDKENALGMELGQLWLVSHVLLPEAANVYVGMANKASATTSHDTAFNDTLYNGVYSANSALYKAWEELRNQFQDLMTISAENLYEVSDVLDEVRTSFASNDGMNATQINEAANSTINGYKNGDFSDKPVVTPGERPHPDDSYTDPLKDNKNYDTGDSDYFEPK